MKKSEPKSSELIVQNSQLQAKKWIYFSVYWPPTQNNLDYIFNDLTTSLSQVSDIYDNFIAMSDFNIEINLPSHEHDKKDQFGNLFNLSNLRKSDTSFIKTLNSKIDLILTNRSNSFQKSKAPQK